MSKPLIPIILLCTLLCGCSGAPGKPSDPAAVQRKFMVPTPPAVMSDPTQRARYLAEHYWDNFDFSDTTDISRPEFLEQAFADYIDILQYADSASADKSIRQMVQKSVANPDVRSRFVELYSKYLFDANSPMRNEELYIPFLEAALAAPQANELDKVRLKYDLQTVMKNRAGTPAADFTYTLVSGRKSTLYNTKADFLILFFSNPGCPACKQIMDVLKDSPVIPEMVKSGKLKVLTLYPDEDLAAWRDYLPQMPAEWINAYDAGGVIEEKELYDLKAIPTLYLLDREKKVLLKDFSSVEQVIRYLAGR